MFHDLKDEKMKECDFEFIKMLQKKINYDNSIECCVMNFLNLLIGNNNININKSKFINDFYKYMNNDNAKTKFTKLIENKDIKQSKDTNEFLNMILKILKNKNDEIDEKKVEKLIVEISKNIFDEKTNYLNVIKNLHFDLNNIIFKNENMKLNVVKNTIKKIDGDNSNDYIFTKKIYDELEFYDYITLKKYGWNTEKKIKIHYDFKNKKHEYYENLTIIEELIDVFKNIELKDKKIDFNCKNFNNIE